MFYRKLISAVVFATFSFCFTEAASAQGCDNHDFCFDYGIPDPAVDNITGSSVTCTLEPGGASQPFNKLDPGTGPGTSDATFTQSGTAACTHLPDNVDLGPCTFELTWIGVTTSVCNSANNSFTAGAFCQDSTLFEGTLNVNGKVTCGTKVMGLGIAGLTSNQCNQVFPM